MLLQTLVLRVLHRERRLSTGSVTQFCFDRIQDASTEDVDTAIDNATEQKNRARVAKYLGSMKAATGETMSLDVVATYWKWFPHRKKNNNRGRRRRKPTTYRATRSMGPFEKKSTSDT